MAGTATYRIVPREGRSTGWRKVYDVLLDGVAIRTGAPSRLTARVSAMRHHIRKGDQSLNVSIKGA